MTNVLGQEVGNMINTGEDTTQEASAVNATGYDYTSQYETVLGYFETDEKEFDKAVGGLAFLQVDLKLVAIP